MRKYPMLTELPTSRDFIDVFGGYNHNLRIGEGEFYDMKNLTSTHYPILATRPKRGTYREVMGYSVVGLIDKDGLWSFEVSTSEHNNNQHNNGSLIRSPNNEIWYTGPVEYGIDVKRNLVSMGAYIVIFPDCYYFNTSDPSDSGQIKKRCYSGRIEAYEDDRYCTYFWPCDKDGNDLLVDFKFDKTTEPNYLKDYEHKDSTNGPINNHYLLETSTGSFYYYYKENESEESGVWLTETPYLKIHDPRVDFSEVFSEGDGIRISGFPDAGYEPNETSAVGDHSARIVDELFDGDVNKPLCVLKVIKNENIGIDGIVVGINPKFKEGEYVCLTRLTYETQTPAMDFVIESGNRLWGCRYGKNNNGDVVNEIYASKLGDFKNWETFAGVSTDSYVASVGSDGEFTGAISYLGNPVFFKQNCIHTVYGSFPAQYQIQTTECRGVQKGCHNSLAIIEGTVFYKAVGGVCAYSGSLPTEIGSALGEEGRRYHGAYGGALRHKYYLGMYDALTEGNTTWLYVFDTQKGLWHKEDEYNGQEFCYASAETIDQLYYLLPVQRTEKIWQSDGTYTEKTYTVHNIKTIIGEGEKADDEDVDWFAETGIIGCFTPDKKYISRISFRLSIDVGTRVYVFAEYDSSGSWEQIGAITGTRLQTFTFPVKPKRCDHLRLRIEGTGEAKIFSISKTMEQGSEL